MTPQQRRIAPRRRPRQVRAELTRERILTAAAHVFATYGYAAGTTNRIADEARCSIGSLYQYFPNKDAILAELLTRHLDQGAATLPPGEEAGDQPLEELVRAMVRTAITNHRDDPRLLRLFMEEAPREGAVMTKIEVYQRDRLRRFRDFLVRHPDAGVEDTEAAAQIVTITLELVVHALSAAPDRVPARRLENELTAMISTYLKGR
ncbi:MULTISPECIES: TetR/AcrR family transcriptional regulator [unclassified Pseudonocardia]|uniref:TetR/AcrR family transcriptional regulator n=1 Tax=unclassified Pseudonocardia TaxID=2619320 RepID=UPI001CF69B68|nr:TetR/AcrR family transcriptional regulator [Pseudonocardia sp. ICBG601]